MSFTVPEKWPDGEAVEAGQLVILVATADFGVEASALFDYNQPRPTVSADPFAEVSPSSGGAGTAVTVRGGGFPANRSVDVFLAALVQARSAATSAPRSYASTTTDSNGNYSVSFALPATWPDGSTIPNGKLMILVATDGYGTQASSTFNYFIDVPNPSITIQPQSGPSGTLIVASGGGFRRGIPGLTCIWRLWTVRRAALEAIAYTLLPLRTMVAITA